LKEIPKKGSPKGIFLRIPYKGTVFQPWDGKYSVPGMESFPSQRWKVFFPWD